MNPTPVVLYGDAVRLEPLDHAHAGDLVEAAADPGIWQYMGSAQPKSLAEVKAWIDAAYKLAAAGDTIPFAVIRPADDVAVGSTRFLEIRREWRTLEVGWTWYAASAQRTAVNTECKYLLLKHAFEDLGALRVQFKTDGRNVRSQRAIERIGGVKEGVLRKQRINDDGYVRDAVYYSILDDEWPAVKTHLEGMLRR
ncbi:MAG: GNAT family N-acetyltransferase [Gemmatimonadales bacterium]|nr:GNAT family N-acetyltransferase [Gemmatimonadales bacterium]